MVSHVGSGSFKHRGMGPDLLGRQKATTHPHGGRQSYAMTLPAPKQFILHWRVTVARVPGARVASGPENWHD